MRHATTKQTDKRIARLYGERCSGIPINIMDIGRVYAAGRAAVAVGGDDHAVGDALLAYVQSIRTDSRQ